MKLYEIDQQLASLIDPETGELLDYETFEHLQIERTDKIEGMALWYKGIAAEAAAIKAEADSLIKRGKSLDSQAERLKAYISMILDGEKFSTPRCAVSFRKSASLEVTDPDALIAWAEKSGHMDCVRYKPPEISKQAVTELIKSGTEVPSAHINYKKNVRII